MSDTNNAACQYCNTPLTHSHQQEQHEQQPCRGSLLAEIERLKAENQEWREELTKNLLSKVKLVEQTIQQQEKLIAAKEENKDLKRTSYTIESLTSWFRKEIDDAQHNMEHAKTKSLYLEVVKCQMKIEIFEQLIDGVRMGTP